MAKHKAGPHPKTGRHTKFPYRLYVIKNINGVQPNQSCSSGDLIVIIKDQFDYEKNAKRMVHLLRENDIHIEVNEVIAQVRNRHNVWGLSAHAVEKVFKFPHDKYSYSGTYESDLGAYDG